jgi:AcrR family transcriptional regulator
MTHRRRRLNPERAERREARRRELVDAATAVIRRDGPGASMDAMAREAGVTKPILYRHFTDRAGLMQALTDRFAEDLGAELRVALNKPVAPREVLHGTIDAFVAFIERDPEMYRFVTQRALAEVPHDVTGLVRRIGREVAVVLGEGLRTAGVDASPAEPWAYGIVGMVHFSGEWWAEHRSFTRERLVSYLTDLLWSGLSGYAPLETPSELLEGTRS